MLLKIISQNLCKHAVPYRHGDYPPFVSEDYRGITRSYSNRSAKSEYTFLRL